MARPPLATLEVALLAARLGSFSEAASDLGITHGAVSRKIASLEAWLGLLLFERHGRGVRPTPDGQRFVAQIDEAFRQIDQASDRWRRPDSSTLRLSVVPAFAKLWLLSRLTVLEAETGCRIDLAIDHRNADLEAGEADIAIRYGRGRWQNLDARPLGVERHYPIASAVTVAELGTRPSLSRLLSMPLIHDSDATGWRNWIKTVHGAALKPKRNDRRFEDYTLTLAAAEEGLGVALARAPMVTSSLRKGQLIVLDDRSSESPLNYFILKRIGDVRSPVLSFIEAVKDTFAEEFCLDPCHDDIAAR